MVVDVLDMKCVFLVGLLSMNKVCYVFDVVVDDVLYMVMNVKVLLELFVLLLNVMVLFEYGKVYVLMGVLGVGKMMLLDVIIDWVMLGEVSGGGVYYGGRWVLKVMFW